MAPLPEDDIMHRILVLDNLSEEGVEEFGENICGLGLKFELVEANYIPALVKFATAMSPRQPRPRSI